MSTDRDVTRIVRSWLEEGATRLPDRVLDNVFDQLPAIPQRRAWWPARRLREMNNFAKFAIVAAAVVVVAFVGLRFLTPDGNLGGLPSESPVTSSSGPVTSSPGSAPSPNGSPIPLHGGPLDPGTYLIGPDLTDHWMECPEQPITGCSNTMRLMFTVPDGWAGVMGSIWLEQEENGPPAGAGMLFTRGGWLRSDPCVPTAVDEIDGAPVDIPVGPTVDDFATALADHPLLDTTQPEHVILAGYSGKYVDLQVPLDTSACHSSYKPWDGNIYAQGPGQRWHLWILDVDGQRVVVETTDYAGTSEQHRAELQAIVDSVVIEP